MDAYTALVTRRSISRLNEPPPNDETLHRWLAAAMLAPDHGQLRPWRFHVFSKNGLIRLGKLFAAAHRIREPYASETTVIKTSKKPLRAPMIVAIICTPIDPENAPKNKNVPDVEQGDAAAAAAQNLCLAAHADGYGAIWRTGWFCDDPTVRDALNVVGKDRIVGWVYIGSVPQNTKLPPRRNVPIEDRLTVWK